MIAPVLTGSRGIALVVILLALGLLSGLGLGLTLSSSLDRLTAANYDDAVAALNAAEAALELAAHELDAVTDWSTVLDGSRQSTLVDGPPHGVRVVPGRSVDLSRLTSEITCGRTTPCTHAHVSASTVDRPWGPDNPHWRPFVHTFLPAVTDPRYAHPPYVIVWLGDDASETDGNPLIDGGGVAAEGRYILRARAEAFGRLGARRAIEAELVRICAASGGTVTCRPGVRIQSWRTGTVSIS
jgi:hypothetical protein